MVTELFRGKISRIITKEVNQNGHTMIFEITERPPGVRLLFINLEGKILLTKEYRHEADGRDYRLPGGKFFDKIAEYADFLENNGNLKEKAKETAIKEAKEETGIIVRECEILAIDKVGSSVSRDLYYMKITKFDETSEQELEHGEHISVNWYSYDQVLEIMKNGKMGEGRTKGFLYDYILNNYV